MRLFARRAGEAVRPALVRAVTGWNGGEWPRSYEAQVRDAYLANPVAQRSVRLVAEGAGSIPIFAAGDAGGERRTERLLGEPLLIETIATQLLLHGNAFVQIVGDADGVPAQLFALRPERVAIEQDARGYPVVESEDMPDVAANSLSIAFGNFQAGYLIAERAETAILRDPFTAKPFVHFYAVKRVGGGVTNSEAIKLMKFAAA